MRKDKPSCKYCIFCRHWGGKKAERSNQKGYWEYTIVYDKCIKKNANLSATHSCREFELDTFTYYD